MHDIQLSQCYIYSLRIETKCRCNSRLYDFEAGYISVTDVEEHFTYMQNLRSHVHRKSGNIPVVMSLKLYEYDTWDIIDDLNGCDMIDSKQGFKIKLHNKAKISLFKTYWLLGVINAKG